MQRHGHHDVENLIARKSYGEQASQRFRQRLNAAVLKKMNELAQRVFVESEGIGGVKSERSPAAQSAQPFFVQRRCSAEWRAALYAKIFSGERFGLRKASPADGHAGNFMERLLAEAAVVGKNQGKEIVEELSGKGRGGNIPGRFC